jgi:NAD(P)-dependent dehydrogenase (short-subunit alcohol dehydrogenase family)
MASFSAICADNATFSPSYFPVALVVGGTSGIGRATVEAFARYTKGEAHIIICGRNRAAAEAIITSFPKSPNGKYEFIACDVSLMKNVHVMTTSLLSTLPKLNFLVLSTGFLNFNGRFDETNEGIDKKLAVDYYARWKLINDLIPLLQKAKDAGEDAKVMSVLAAGKGGTIDLNDLGLKKGYSFTGEMAASATYNDIMVDVNASSFIRSELLLTVFSVICRSASRYGLHSHVSRLRSYIHHQT